MDWLRPLIDEGIAVLVAKLTDLWAFINDNLQPVFQSLATFIVETVQPGLQALGTTLTEAFSAIQEELGPTFEAIVSYITPVIDGIQTRFTAFGDAVRVVFEAIAQFLTDHGETIKTVLGDAWGIIQTTIETVINVVRDVILVVLNLIQGDWSEAWDAVKKVGEDLWNGIKDVILRTFTKARLNDGREHLNRFVRSRSRGAAQYERRSAVDLRGAALKQRQGLCNRPAVQYLIQPHLGSLLRILVQRSMEAVLHGDPRQMGDAPRGVGVNGHGLLRPQERVRFSAPSPAGQGRGQGRRPRR